MRNPRGPAWSLAAGLLCAASVAPANAETRVGLQGGGNFSTFQTSPKEEGVDFGTNTTAGEGAADFSAKNRGAQSVAGVTFALGR